MVDGQPTSMIGVLLDNLERDADRVVLRYKSEDEWLDVDWQQIGNDAGRYACVLAQRGVTAGERVIFVSENRYEWLLVDLAILLLGGIHVPVHAPLTGYQVAYQTIDSGAVLVIVSNQAQADKLTDMDLPEGIAFLSLEPVEGSHGFETIPELADAVDDQTVQQILEHRRAEPLESSGVATILYTSGTTGEPKGVMLSHHNLVSNTLAAAANFDMVADDVHLNFLPLSHIFARTCDYYGWLQTGNMLVLAQSGDTIIADCVAQQPTQLNGVPYFFEKLQRVLKGRDQDQQAGSLRDLLGGKMRRCNSGGAALAESVFDFFTEQGVHLLQGYGLTETSPVISMSSEGHSRRGASGRPLQGVEVAIAEDGEIITRGDHVMLGYYKNEQATAEAIRDNWFYTGDLGKLDEDGYVYITGRKKELIVTAGGKNIAPVLLESMMLEDLLIEQALVIGSERKFLTALIVIGQERLRAWLAEQGLELSWPDEVCQHQQVLELYRQTIDRQLEKLSRFEQVGKFVLLAEPFSVERGEMTAKLSLRRNVIQDHFSEQIETMYGDS
jgi:long-chain acyl-CoA synthetase